MANPYTITSVETDTHGDDSFDQYPHYPGSQGGETSDEAAAELAPSLGRLQRIVQHAITEAGADGLTGDEIGARTGINKYTVRARTAELRKAGSIADSGERRVNCTGRRAIVWTQPEHVREKQS